MHQRHLILLYLLVPGLLTAQISINWGSGFSLDEVVESDGTTLASPGNGFTFEIGTFGSSFTPTASNIDQWAANWKVFDDGPFFFPVGNTALYYGSATLSSSQVSSTTGNTFAIGEQAYVWIYNDNNYANIDTTTEWALYSKTLTTGGPFGSPWQMPDASSSTLSRTWFVTNADTAVWGGVDSGADVGSGNIIDTPGSYHVQTAGFTAGVFWDINGSTAGATNDVNGEAFGTWNTSNTNWSNDPTGKIATGAFSDHKVATFSANDGGSGEADGTFTVTKAGNADVFGLDFQEGTVTIGHGSSGNINFDTDGQTIAFNDGDGFDGLTSTAFINVYNGVTATIETAISSSQDVNLTGGGTLVLAGTQTGEIDGTLTLESGTLQMSGTGTNPRLGFNSGGQTIISIEGGTLLVSENSATKNTDVQFGSTTNVVYSEGKIEIGESNDSLGTLSLTLSSTSEIDFTGSGTASIIKFADSSAIDWSTSQTLEVVNWDGNPLNFGTGTGGGGTDQFFIGNNASGLTALQLDKIKFINPIGLPAGIYDAYILSTGEVVPGVIPEPSTYLFGSLLLLFGTLDGYRRFRAKRVSL